MSNDSVSRSWFAVLPNPTEHGYSGTPQEICEAMRDEWIAESDTRTGAWAYCISAGGLHHVHCVLEDKKAMRWSIIRNNYAFGSHMEPTKGTKEQAEAYIAKIPPYDEKGETVVCLVRHGEIKGRTGKRSDLDEIAAMLEAGFTPGEIFAENISYRRYERLIRGAFYDLRKAKTPIMREVKVHYITGSSGSGKSHHYVDLCEEFGEDQVYHVSNYETGFMDNYQGEPILFLDEFKGQIPFGTLLVYLDGYRSQFHARYVNGYMLWTQVYISSIFPPHSLYNRMVSAGERHEEAKEQLLRRITDITLCYVDGAGQHHTYTVKMEDYRGIDVMRREAYERDHTLNAS